MAEPYACIARDAKLKPSHLRMRNQATVSSLGIAFSEFGKVSFSRTRTRTRTRVSVRKFRRKLRPYVAHWIEGAWGSPGASRAFVKQDKSREVPVHLRDATTKLMKVLGYGHEYRYAYDEPNAYAAGETYLPECIGEPR